MTARNSAISLALVAAFLMGCAKKETAASPVAHDPCSLLSAQEVGQILHAQMGERKATDETHCTYAPAAGAINMLILEAAWSGADTAFTGYKTGNALVGGAQSGPKVGDESFFGAAGQVFYARKGDAYLAVDMRAVTGDTKHIGPAIAQMAIARL